MKKNIKKITFFLGLIFCFFIKAGSVFALEIDYPTILGQPLNSSSDFPQYACYIYGLGINLAAFIAVMAIAFGGVAYLLDYGRGKFTSDAKSWIKSGILGLLIVICAAVIASTISSGLSTCKVGILSAINIENEPGGIPVANVKTTGYKEIPIGTLTETLLTRKIDCYGFTQSGDPVDGLSPSGELEPTFMEHDRADCITQLMDGTQKKAQTIATLSSKINALMGQCDCQKWGKCEKNCSTCDQPTSCPNPGGYTCTGDCVTNPSCKPPMDIPETPLTAAVAAPKDCCPTDSGVEDPKNPGKNLSVKDLFEHGPMKISFDVDLGSSSTCPDSGCCTDVINYNGLDEFRSSYDGDYTAIKELVEKDITLDSGKETTIIDTGNCQKCSTDYRKCDSLTGQALKDCQKKNGTVDDYNKCEKDFKDCRDKSAWYQLPLVDQLTYFKGKADELVKTVSDDKRVLDQARSTLSSCYLAIPYGDLVKTAEVTDKKQNIILRRPDTFVDPVTHERVDASKYCTGFNYNNSSCLGNCNNACPDSSTPALDCYKNCGPACVDNCEICDPSILYGGMGVGGYAACLSKRKICEEDVDACRVVQQDCVETCYNSRPCIYSQDSTQTFGTVKCNPSSKCKSGQICKDNGTGTNTCNGVVVDGTQCDPATDTACPNGQICDPKTSVCVKSLGDQPQDCLSQCQGDCSKVCEDKYLPCSKEYNECLGQCQGNSQCVLNNASACLFDAKNLVDCASKDIKDEGNADYCINSSYLCKNGSDQYAGYQDCTQTVPRPNSSINGIRSTVQALFPYIDFGYWSSEPIVDCTKDHSAAFLFDHPECQKCIQANDPPDTFSSCSPLYGNAAPVDPAQAKLDTCLSDCQKKAGVGITMNVPIYNECADVCNKTFKNTSPVTTPQDPSIDNSCKGICPETAKCPASSKCPTCPCDLINANLSFVVPVASTSANAGKEGYTPSAAKVTSNQMVGPQCDGYSYNDDPLTFYCEDNWWSDPEREGNSPTPLGAERYCQKNGEVPVGQAVDDAENWALSLVNNVRKLNRSVQSIITRATTAGLTIDTPPAQDYCKCGAEYDTGDPICTVGCNYSEFIVGENPDTGEPIYSCSCDIRACRGNSCKQMIRYMSNIWNAYRTLKSDFVTFYAGNGVIQGVLSDPRSDVLKELSYSRKMANSCSLVNSSYGASSRLLDCTRVEDELIPPINKGEIKLNGETFPGYCYGSSLGIITTPALSLTDNWFCCQEWSSKPTTVNGIYNQSN